MTDHPATIHGRSFALVRHMLRGDLEAVAVLAAEPLLDQTAACAQILSLTEVAALVVAYIPEPERERLFDEITVTLAQQEPPAA